MTEPLVVVGDVLLDRDVLGTVERIAPDAPVPVVDERSTQTRAGGAGLAATLAARDGRPVTLVTALAADPAADELRRALERSGVNLIDLGLDGRTPEKIRVICEGHPMLRLDRGGREAGSVGAPGAAARAAIEWAPAVLVSDYGRGVAAEPGLRAALLQATARASVVWDPHPRGPDPTRGAQLATPNAAEAARLVPEVSGSGVALASRRARALASRWEARHVCVTMGADGVVLVGFDGAPLALPVEPVRGGDPCGAGDRFASAAAGAIADGATPEEAVTLAAAEATAFVAAGGAGAAFEPDERRENADPLGRVRARGGTVVATGGCFDLLHPGHIRTLEAARALGDCLVVCINSDDSVRRLKGPGRPLVPAADRAAVLGALACVDEVLVFDEDTPERTLDRIRPHVWAKGGDYAGRELPESAVLERWGGRAVVLPFLDGHSTTRLIEEATGHG